MTNSKHLKKALLTSIISLMVCFSMLVGTTFAWFTDSVSSKNNIIVAGNLDVELYYLSDETADWTKVDTNTNVFKNTLWEPGHTEVVKLKVVNEGTLALKYQLGVSIYSEVGSTNVFGDPFKLSDFIKYGIVDGDQTYTRDQAISAVDATATKLNAIYNTGTKTLASTKDSVVTMVVYMPSTVMNEANAKKGVVAPSINLGIDLIATQLDSEEDSFGSDYDAGAYLPLITSEMELLGAIEAGESVVKLGADIVLSQTLSIPAGVQLLIDLNGYNISVSSAPSTSSYAVRTYTSNTVYAINNEGELVIKDSSADGTGSITGVVTNAGKIVIDGGNFDADSAYALNNQEDAQMIINNATVTSGICNSGDLEIKDGKISTDLGEDASAVYSDGGTLAISGGEFSGNGGVVINANNDQAVINGGSFEKVETPSQLLAGKNMVVNNGEFFAYEGEGSDSIDCGIGEEVLVNGGSFNVAPENVTDGYKPVQKEDGSWELDVAIKSGKDLQDAVDNAKNGDTITFLQNVTAQDGCLITDKNITIDLNGFTYTVTEGASVNYRCFKINGNSNVIVKNGTLVAQGSAYGTIRTEGTANVTLEGLKLYNYLGGGLNVKVNAGTKVTINNTEIYSQYGGGVEACGGEIEMNNASIDQKGVYDNGWYSVAICINGGGKVTVNSGDYSASTIPTDANASRGNSVAFILSSGGNLVINGGTFTSTVAETAAASNFCGLIYADKAAVVEINGGTFTGGPVLDMRNNAGSLPNPTATLKGGLFDANPTVSGLYASNLIKVAEGYKVVEKEDGTWVVDIAIQTGADLQEAILSATDGATIKLLADVELSAQNAQELFKPVYNRETYCGIYIPDDKAITLDLNGKVISYVDTYGDVDNVMILNIGNLTINDSVGGGKITYKPVESTSSYAKFYSTIFNCGTLTVNGGTIENTCETARDVTDAVDNHSRLSHEYGNDCILVVNGGTLTGSEYYSVRQYTHYSEGVKNRIIVNGGTFNNGIYMQHGESWYFADPAAKRLNVDCQVEINDGEFFTCYEGASCLVSRLSNPDNNAWKISVNGGVFHAPIKLRVQRGVYYANGVSGATVPAEETGARNAEWLAKNGGFISGGTFYEIGSEEDMTSNLVLFLAGGYEFAENEDGTWSVEKGAVAKVGENSYYTIQEALENAKSGDIVQLLADVESDAGISIPEGVTLDGCNNKIIYTVADDYHLVSLYTGATLKNVTLKNYRARTETTTNGVVSLENVVIDMDNDLTGLDISRGAGTAKLTKVICKGTKDAAHLDPNTQVQVDYTPYGDVLLGGAWALEATDCDFGSLHGWNTRNGSNVSLNNTTCTVFRMHYWSNRTLYIDGVETAWSESGAIPVAHDVGGCWSVQPAFK